MQFQSNSALFNAFVNIFLILLHLFPQSKNGKCVRIFLTVILACQTVLPEDYVKGQPLNRNDLTCKVTYCSVGTYNWIKLSLME